MNIVHTVIGRLDPPTQAQLAKTCKRTPQAVTRWISTGLIPPKHVLVVEKASGVSRHQLRPDVFGVGNEGESVTERAVEDPDAARIVPVEGA
ncbi:transcriptional regulator [Xanthomonas theicola]|uniref:Helix-turn-helix domain-containing protein n=1 Tax=Xanthomonas theicola TaxID=56464 RepID=A0A2S6ZLY1_9XANT|nr:YdaS family helix-turn-helix protein [Xanthomonas theicola]PPT93245.1 hypothetical protein XthCFBP4691_01135 [Xanthomonas theicola]QNH24821.1 helix-turn-helix domain-containing protein [Xanthomonas theicola]